MIESSSSNEVESTLSVCCCSDPLAHIEQQPWPHQSVSWPTTWWVQDASKNTDVFNIYCSNPFFKPFHHFFPFIIALFENPPFNVQFNN